MTTKGEMLARIRAALGTSPMVPQVPRDYRRVDRGVADPVGLLDRLVNRLEDYNATVLRAPEAEIGDAVAEGLAGVRRVAVPRALPFEWLPASVDGVSDSGMTAEELDEFDAVVTGATLAIAETGTIILDGSPGQGRRALTLVPDLHVCVLRADQVVWTVPAALSRLDATRPQTWISGPSATSDIELNRVEGVHGPRTLVVVLAEGGRSYHP